MHGTTQFYLGEKVHPNDSENVQDQEHQAAYIHQSWQCGNEGRKYDLEGSEVAE